MVMGGLSYWLLGSFSGQVFFTSISRSRCVSTSK